MKQINRRQRWISFLFVLILACGPVIGASSTEEGAALQGSPATETAAQSTPTPTEAPTPAPTPEPTPTQAPTEAPTPSPTPVPEASPTAALPSPSPSGHPTDSPAPSATPAVPPPSPLPFEKGLARLEAGTALYEDPDMTKPLGVFSAEVIVWAEQEPNASAALVLFTLNEETVRQGYVAASGLRPLTETEAAAYAARPGGLALLEGVRLFPAALELPPALLLEETPVPFPEGLVTLPSGTLLWPDETFGRPLGTLTAEGVAYLLPRAADPAIPASVAFTLDGETLQTGFLAADAAFAPLTDPAMLAAYLLNASPVVHQGMPLFPLAFEPFVSYELSRYGFPGLPENYVLSPQELAAKAALETDGILRQTLEGTPGVTYAADELLLLTDSKEYAEMVAASYAATLKSHSLGLAVIQLEGHTVLEALQAAADPMARLIAATPNYLFPLEPNQPDGGSSSAPKMGMSLMSVPTLTTWADYKSGDPYLQNPSATNYQYMHDVVGTYGAWGLTQGDPSVKVGVVDSGADGTHTELAGKLEDMTNLGGATSLTDDNGHGTHVLGIIAAKVGNHSGGAGIAPNVTLRVYKVLNASGAVATTYVHDALAQMANLGNSNRPWVINMSLGGTSYDPVLNDAVKKCIDAGIPIIAAAGNSGGGERLYPANCDGVISVAATDVAGQRAPYSNYGGATLAAPGSYIVSTYKGGAYAFISGTSMATPVVTGVAALYYSARGTRDLNGDGWTDAKDVAYLKNALTASCVRASGSGLGAGIVNAVNLFKNVVGKPRLSLVSPADVAYTGSLSTVPNAFFLQMDAGYNGQYIVYTDDGSTPSVKDGQVHGTELDRYAPKKIPLGGYPLGRRTIKALAVNAQGKVSSVATLAFTLTNIQTPDSLSILGPQFVAAGKAAVYTVATSPATTSPKVVWSILEGGDIASISATTGKLTAKAGQSGPVKIQAVHTLFPSLTAELEIQINRYPVQRVIMAPSALVLNVGKNSQDLFPLAILADPAATPVLSEEGLTYQVTVSNPKIVSVAKSEPGQGPYPVWQLRGLAPGKATVKFAVLDGSGKYASLTVTVKNPVTDVAIEGGDTSCLAAGKSKTLRAVVEPSTATTKTVVWKLLSAPAGVTLSSSGVLKALASADLLTPVKVRVETKDLDPATGLPSAVAEQTLTLLSSPVATLTLTSGDPKRKKNAYGTLVGGTLFTVDAPASDFGADDERFFQLGYTATGSSVNPVLVIWSSNRPHIATVDETGLVTARAPGTATITCTAADGSGKKASISLQVLIPASSLRARPVSARADGTPANLYSLAFGKAGTISVAYGAAYGTPTQRKVAWAYTAFAGGEDITEECQTRRLVSISASGKIVAKARSQTDGGYQLTVTAKTIDGTGLADSFTYRVQPPTVLMGALKNPTWCVALEGEPPTPSLPKQMGAHKGVPFGSSVVLTSDLNEVYYFYFYTDNMKQNDFAVTSSNMAVAAPVCPVFPSTGYLYQGPLPDLTAYPKAKSATVLNTPCSVFKIAVKAYKPGTAKITVKAGDSTGKSCTFTVKVIE